MITEEQVRAALGKCYDPELNESVVDLGLVYGIEVKGDEVNVRMTMTTPSCPYIPALLKDAEQKVRDGCGAAKVTIEVVWDPPWSVDRMSDDLKLKLGMEGQ